MVKAKNAVHSLLSDTQIFERQIRAQASSADLTYHLVNDFPRFANAQQGFAYRSRANGEKTIVAAGSVPDVNRDASVIRAVETRLRRVGSSAPEPLKLDDIPELRAMPYAMTLPFARKFSSSIPEAALLVSSTPWSKQAAEQAAYLAEVYSHAFQNFAAIRKRRWARFRRSVFALGVTAILAVLALVPLPITVIAPARVTSAVSLPAAPSLEGIVDRLYVEAGQAVPKGATLYSLRDRAAQASYEEAQARVLVAQARETQLRAEGLRNPAARQELKLAQAETELAQIELKRSQDILDRHIVRAPIDGMIVGDGLSSLEGTPLTFGDAPLRVVDPKSLRLQADVAIADTSVVYGLTQARVYFNDAPTDPQALTVLSLPFEPKPDVRGGVSYALLFDLDPTEPEPALGAEGVVQLSGSEKPMGYVLMRRPIQWLFARMPW